MLVMNMVLKQLLPPSEKYPLGNTPLDLACIEGFPNGEEDKPNRTTIISLLINKGQNYMKTIVHRFIRRKD